VFSGFAKGKSFTSLRNNQTIIINHTVLNLSILNKRAYLKFLQHNLKLLKFSSGLFGQRNTLKAQTYEIRLVRAAVPETPDK
jgi:hypothetical protein